MRDENMLKYMPKLTEFERCFLTNNIKHTRPDLREDELPLIKHREALAAVNDFIADVTAAGGLHKNNTAWGLAKKLRW